MYNLDQCPECEQNGISEKSRKTKEGVYWKSVCKICGYESEEILHLWKEIYSW